MQPRLPMYYKVPGTALIHEPLDDEVILANLDTGVYYSIRYCGVPFWQLLISGYSFKDVKEIFAKRYQADFSPSLNDFMNQLLSENVLIETSSAENRSSIPEFHWPLEFTPPTLEKYEEMKELLVIDPIHEVDTKGWPNRSNEQVHSP